MVTHITNKLKDAHLEKCYDLPKENTLPLLRVSAIYIPNGYGIFEFWNLVLNELFLHPEDANPGRFYPINLVFKN